MSIQKKISEEFKVEIKEHFNDVSAIMEFSNRLADCGLLRATVAADYWL